MRKPSPRLPRRFGRGHAHVVVHDLAVLAADVTHGGHGPLDQVAGRVGGHDDRAELHVLLGVGLGLGEHRGERGPGRAGGEPLVAVDDPLVAVEVGRGLHLGRVAAGHLGLGEADRREHVAGHHRVEEALALLGAGVQVHHHRVLHRRRADGHLAVLRAADDLVQVHEVHERQPAAADLGRMPERPEAALLGLGLEVGHDAGGAPAGGVAGAGNPVGGVQTAGFGQLVELERQPGVGVEAVLGLALQLRFGLEHDVVDEILHPRPHLADLVAHPDRLCHVRHRTARPGTPQQRMAAPTLVRRVSQDFGGIALQVIENAAVGGGSDPHAPAAAPHAPCRPHRYRATLPPKQGSRPRRGPGGRRRAVTRDRDRE